MFEEFFDAFVIRNIESTPRPVLQDLREVAPNADQLRPEMIVPNLRYAGLRRVERNIDEDGVCEHVETEYVFIYRPVAIFLLQEPQMVLQILIDLRMLLQERLQPHELQ